MIPQQRVMRGPATPPGPPPPPPQVSTFDSPDLRRFRAAVRWRRLARYEFESRMERATAQPTVGRHREATDAWEQVALAHSAVRRAAKRLARRRARS